VGAQRPTHLLTPEGSFDFSDGDDAIALASALGLELFDWQRWLVRWILAVDGNGAPACRQVIIEVPRQNGKGAILECIELYWLIVAGVKIVKSADIEMHNNELATKAQMGSGI
jgi:phage terminase large subunit-like protein